MNDRSGKPDLWSLARRQLLELLNEHLPTTDFETRVLIAEDAAREFAHGVDALGS